MSLKRILLRSTVGVNSVIYIALFIYCLNETGIFKAEKN